MQANSIAFINQKGGVGKTMTAAAVLIDAAAKVRVLGADLDGKQQSLLHWSERRAQHMYLPPAQVRAVTFSQAKLMAHDCDLLIVDTPGWTDVETIELAHFADLIVIPTATNRDEMDPSALLVQALWENKVHPEKIAVVFTRVCRRRRRLRRGNSWRRYASIRSARPWMIGRYGERLAMTAAPFSRRDCRQSMLRRGLTCERSAVALSAASLQAEQALSLDRRQKRRR